MEPLLWSCILTLLSTHDRDGLILDAGAHDGRSSMMMADAFEKHTLYAIEPIQENIDVMYRNNLHHRKNVRIVHGGLGDSRKFGTYSSSMLRKLPQFKKQIGILPQHKRTFPQTLNDTIWFPIYPVDELLFREKYKKLSFAHWDTEGSEVSVLEGAKNVIWKDRPLFSVESFPNLRRKNDAILKAKIKDLNYTCMVIHEVCGFPRDCRNYMCVPNEKKDETILCNSASWISN